MKSIFKPLLAGIFLPACAVTFLQTTNSINKPTTLEKIDRPYVVDIIDTDGNLISQSSGVSNSGDPFLIAQELNVNPNKEDKFTAFPDLRMGIGSKITLYRAPDFTIYDGKKKTEIRSWTDTVGKLLTEAKVPILGDDDKINFSPNTILEDGMEIRIIRVAITTVREAEPIAYKTIKKEDKNLDQGKTRIDKKGENGVRTLTYTVRREDGIQVSKVLSKSEVTKEPVDEILIIGTKPVITGWCKFNDLVLDASIKNNLDPNKLCALMRLESNGNPKSVSGGGHLGLFQYTEGFWTDASKKAGFAGASWQDPKAQIYTTAWALTHGYAGRW